MNILREMNRVSARVLSSWATATGRMMVCIGAYMPLIVMGGLVFMVVMLISSFWTD